MKEPVHSVLDNDNVIFRYIHPQTKAPFEVQIFCPLPSRLHEQHAQVREAHRAWARSFRIPSNEENYQRYCDTRLDLLASYQCHDLPLEAAALHSHLMTWFFVFDDVMDIDHGLDEELRPLVFELFKRHLDLLDGAVPDEGDPHCIHAFHDFLKQVKRVAAGSLNAWYERMVFHLREYVSGAHWESMIGPTTDKNANTALYLQVRHMAVGVAPCLDLMALQAGVPPEPLLDDLFLRRMERLAINISIWINDLAGLNRDLRRGLGNVVFTLQKDHALGLQDAARMLGRMCDAEVEAFLMMEKQLPVLVGERYASCRPAYERYVSVMKNWIRGLLDWSVRSERYQRVDQDMALQNRNQIRRALLKGTSGEK